MDDEFCAHCGQRNTERLVSVRRFAAEALEDQLSLNGTLPRSAGALLLRPGHLTCEYVSGRIARYVAPLKLYLVASLLFFIAISIVADPASLSRRVSLRYRDRDARTVTEDQRRGAVFVSLDTVGAPGWMMPMARSLAEKGKRLNAMPPEEAERAQLQALQNAAPKVFFLLVPVFAAILKLLYVRRKRLYAEHFVFALHFHSLVFTLATAAVLTRSLIVAAVAGAWVLVYLLLALRRVYAQGWVRTSAKYLLLVLLYTAALGFATFVLAIATVATT
ncbi:MAG TPA: DUF3667 domain-containing protein [Longimicrobium sp.]